jgi:hypothetical protein
MFDRAEYIVGLWFLPVTLCIIIPLTLLVGRSVVTLFTRRKTNSEGPEVEEDVIT